MWQPRPRVHPHAPVVALDIDGTLGDYHTHFTRFAEQYLQRRLHAVWDPAHEGEFSEALGLDKATYRDIKLAYRQGGMKRSLPMFYGSDEMVRAIRDQNYQVWICTTRPWLRLDNIDKDTAFWLEHNGIQFDGVLFGEEKYEDLVDIVGVDRVVCAVDDLPEQVVKADMLGINVALRSGDHNLYWEPNPPVAIVRNQLDLMDFVFKAIKRFEENNA